MTLWFYNPWLTVFPGKVRAAVKVTKNLMGSFDVDISQNIKLWGI